MDNLTANQRRVLEVLQQADAPLGAYAILKETGFRGATQVYRALDRLGDLGFVRKLESLNAFIACADQGRASPAAFLICDQCGLIHELADAREIKELQASLDQSNFQVIRAVVELHGICSSCAGRATHAEKVSPSNRSRQV